MPSPKDSLAIDAVVAADGSGDYTTVTAAVAATPSKSTKRHVIHVKAGFYKEILNIGGDIWNLTLVGDGINATIISGNRSVDDPIPTTTDKTPTDTDMTPTVSEYRLPSLRSS